jgi:hypothetical protein
LLKITERVKAELFKLAMICFLFDLFTIPKAVNLRDYRKFKGGF